MDQFWPYLATCAFIEKLSVVHPERLAGMRGLIACSSSSAITKRFAANRFDRELVAHLNLSEDLLFSICRRLHVPCCVLQPLLFTARWPYGDRNLSRLLSYSGISTSASAC